MKSSCAQCEVESDVHGVDSRRGSDASGVRGQQSGGGCAINTLGIDLAALGNIVFSQVNKQRDTDCRTRKHDFSTSTKYQFQSIGRE